MAAIDLAITMILLLQTTFGILWNFYLLYHYIFFYSTGYRLKSTDLILTYLTIANFLVITSKGILQTMAAFDLKNFLNDFGCRLVFYIHKVSINMSISTACLLSIFQAIKISPRDSRLAYLKELSHKCIIASLNLCWILYILLNISFPLYVYGKWNSINITNKMDLEYSSGIKSSWTLFAALLICPDIVCVFLMIWATESMVLTLYRHKKQVQHIQSKNLSPRSSPEKGVAQSIVYLVSTFVCCYTLSFFFSFYWALFANPSFLLLNIHALIVSCFPTVSPFLLWSCDSRLPKHCSAYHRRTTQFPKFFHTLVYFSFSFAQYRGVY